MPKKKSIAEIVFQFLGWHDDWYVLRADTGRPHKPLAVHAFQNKLIEWLIEQDITPNRLSYLANGNTGDGPAVPVAPDGSQLCLLLKRPTDVVRFDLAFRCEGITPKTMWEAIRAEASVHKVVLMDVVIVAYSAVRQFGIILGEHVDEWDDLDDDIQQLHLQMAQEYYLQIQQWQSDWTPTRLHEMWVDFRLKEGWRYGADVDLDKRRHPFLVPFTKLSVNVQRKLRLFADIVASMSPSL